MGPPLRRVMGPGDGANDRWRGGRGSVSMCTGRNHLPEQWRSGDCRRVMGPPGVGGRDETAAQSGVDQRRRRGSRSWMEFLLHRWRARRKSRRINGWLETRSVGLSFDHEVVGGVLETI